MDVKWKKYILRGKKKVCSLSSRSWNSLRSFLGVWLRFDRPVHNEFALLRSPSIWLVFSRLFLSLFRWSTLNNFCSLLFLSILIFETVVNDDQFLARIILDFYDLCSLIHSLSFSLLWLSLSVFISRRFLFLRIIRFRSLLISALLHAFSILLFPLLWPLILIDFFFWCLPSKSRVDFRITKFQVKSFQKTMNSLFSNFSSSAILALFILLDFSERHLNRNNGDWLSWSVYL